MKYTAQVLLLMVVCLGGIGCTGDRVSGGGPLRMADSLEGWGYYLADPDARMEDVWRIEDGVLVCSGTPLGYLYTKAEYADFVLKLQWRWPEGKDPGKAGVLIRTVGPHRIWPKSLEAQLNWPDAGDFWGLAGYDPDPGRICLTSEGSEIHFNNVVVTAADRE